MKETTDEHILELMRQRPTQERGFRLLMGKYQERIYWHIRRMVVSHEDANDVIQNTFIKVFKGIGNFRGNSSLYTWIYRIATNEALTFIQKQKRRQMLTIDSEDASLSEKLAADAYFDGDEAQARLVQAIHTLPEKQRLVFNMRYHDDMQYKDISEVLGTSVGALKASYHHAVRKIEDYLKAVET